MFEKYKLQTKQNGKLKGLEWCEVWLGRMDLQPVIQLWILKTLEEKNILPHGEITSTIDYMIGWRYSNKQCVKLMKKCQLQEPWYHDWL